MGEDKTTDIFGLAPYGETIKIAVEKTLDGAGAFLGRICLPAAEEYGLLLRDKVRTWRARNVTAIVTEAENLHIEHGINDNVHAHPRLVHKIMDEGSWSDEPDIQKMWAGLLSSSCTASGKDLDNLTFANLLAQLSPAQARLLNMLCERATKVKTSTGLLMCANSVIPHQELHDVTQIDDQEILDLEIDRLRDLGLLGALSGLGVDGPYAQLRPTPIALKLHLRAKGVRTRAVDYYQAAPYDINIHDNMQHPI